VIIFPYSSTSDIFKIPLVDQGFSPGKSALVAMAEFICALEKPRPPADINLLKIPIYSQGKLLSIIALLRVLRTTPALE
jgi:hypothetical protein